MTTANQLATAKFVRIGSGHTVAEAVGIAFDPASSTLREVVIAVLDTEGQFLGLVEPRNILDRLGSELSASEGGSESQVAGIRRGLAVTVSELVRPEVPHVLSGDSLAILLKKSAQADAAYLPLFDNGEFIGVIPVTAIFDAVCQLTLSGRTGDMPFLNP